MSKPNIEQKRAELKQLLAHQGSLQGADLSSKQSQSNADQAIAIVGIGGQFANCDHVSEFWQAIGAQQSLITATPKRGEDLAYDGFGGFIPDISGFDADFFNYLAPSAEQLDPRIRLLLQNSYHCLEDAQLAPLTTKGKPIGVFVGAEDNEYLPLLLQAGQVVDDSLSHSPSMLANCLSYFYDWRGPSETVNAMCAGGAVAVNKAMHYLERNQTAMALVAGVNLCLGSQAFAALSDAGQLSQDSTVRSFAPNADGYLRAEACVCLLLQSYQQAQTEQRPVYGLMVNSEVGFNGQGGMSIAAPNSKSHSEVIKSCYQGAGIDAAKVNYIEAQGMGNVISDISEIDAFNRALGTHGDQNPCWISTLKPQAGHAHSASSLVAMVKVLASFANQTIYPVSGFERPHQDLALQPDDSQAACSIAQSAKPWPAQADTRRYAGIHSFGNSGTVGHILLSDTPQSETFSPTTELFYLPLSHKTRSGLKTRIANIGNYLSQLSAKRLAHLSNSLCFGRDVFAHRLLLVVDLQTDFKHLLENAVTQLANEDLSEQPLRLGLIADNCAPQDVNQQWFDGFLSASVQPTVNWPKYTLANRDGLGFAPNYAFQTKSYWYHRSANNRAKQSTQAPVLAASYTSNHQQIVLNQQQLIALIEKLLVEQLQVDSDKVRRSRQFADYGIDSINANVLIRAINQALNISVKGSLLLGAQTIEQMAQLLLKHQPSNTQKAVLRANQKGINADTTNRQAIAIVGIGALLPQAQNVGEFWQRLLEQQPLFAPVPISRWRWQDFYGEGAGAGVNKGKQTLVNQGAFILDVFDFDSLFFAIAPSEAQYIDPHQRLLLQQTHACIADAGMRGEDLAADNCTTSVYIGINNASFSELIRAANIPINPHLSAGDLSFTANRISYAFDFSGSSEMVNTACSSFLVAVDKGAKALQQGSCDVALIGAANIDFTVTGSLLLSDMDILSKDNLCRSFDVDASGQMPGESACMVMLKPLSAAINDQDNIYGQIIASDTGHYGGASGSMLLPDATAMADFIKHTLQSNDIDIGQIGYIEAHGSGGFGDSVELNAFEQVWATVDNQQPVNIASIKSYLGSAGAASGASALIKVLLMLKYQQYLPSLHFNAYPQGVALDKLQVISDLQPLDETRPLVAINSYGLGGSLAFLCLKAYHQQIESTPGTFLLPVSGKTAAMRQAYAKVLGQYLQQHREQLTLAQIAFTLQQGRTHYDYRLVCIADSIEQASDSLLAYGQNGEQQHSANLYLGHADDSLQAVFGEDNSTFEQMITTWVSAQKWSEIAALYTRGIAVNWSQTMSYQGLTKVSLPPYPLKKKPLLLPKNDVVDAPSVNPKVSVETINHPLQLEVHSTGFKRVFDGQEFYLAEHQVMGSKVLPGVVYLEMASAALAYELQTNKQTENNQLQAWQISDVFWMQPFSFDTNQAIYMDWQYQDDIGHFYIYSVASVVGTDDSNNGQQIHAQGQISAANGAAYSPAKPQTIDIAKLKRQLRKKSWQGADCYAAFTTMGLDYYGSFQALQLVRRAKNQVLGQLTLSDKLVQQLDVNRWMMFPGLLDGALQTAIGLFSDEQMAALNAGKMDNISPAIPFTLAKLNFYQPLSNDMYCWVRRAGDQQEARQSNLDIDFINPQGQVCVQLRGFSTLTLNAGQDFEQPLNPQTEFIGVDVNNQQLNFVADIVASLLGLEQDEIKVDDSLVDYGLSSIMAVQLFNQLRQYFPTISTTVAMAAQSIEQLSQYLITHHQQQFAELLVSGIKGQIKAKRQFRFNELVALNDAAQEQHNHNPGVFWFHPGLGGVHPYFQLATGCERPFFGVQAKGFQSEDEALIGIEAMAAHYIEVIRSVQPAGPYDFGGYSMGGLIAYEVTRQLQQQGERVNSIVMLDTYDSKVTKDVHISHKSGLLQAVNSMILAANFAPPTDIWISRNDFAEPAKDLNDDLFTQQLTAMAQKRGVKLTSDEIAATIEKMALVQQCYRVDEYVVQQLKHPEQVKCYFFRNQSGLFLGQLSHYQLVDDAELPIDNKVYWQQWQVQLPNFYMLDMPAPNHLSLLTVPDVAEPIEQFCRQLYSEQGLKDDDWQHFEQRFQSSVADLAIGAENIK